MHESHHEHHHMNMVKDFKIRFWVSLALTVPVLLLSPIIQGFLGLSRQLAFNDSAYFLFFFSSIIYFYGGWPFLKGLVSELKSRNPGMMTLIAVAITVAYVYSCAIVFGLHGMNFFWELATLIDIMLLGHWIEMKSVMGASKALEKLAALMPEIANRLNKKGEVEAVNVAELKKGDLLLIKPGEKVPADGVVIKGSTSINESMLTGESKPINKSTGDPVIGGSINGEGALTIKVTKIGGETFLSQVIKLVKTAQESKSKTQEIANTAARWLTIIALTCGTLTLLVWVSVSDRGIAFAIERMVTVMVITCPHALGLAVPLVIAASTSIAAANGLLIRNRSSFEMARNIQAIIFDKTGTLTMGEFGITDVIVMSKFKKAEIIKYAASIEQNSEHSIAKGIVRDIKTKFSVEDFQAIPGKGAQGKVNGKSVKVVSPSYLKESHIKYDNEQLATLSAAGKTVVYLLIDDKLAGALALADIIRPESKIAIQKLQAMGIECIMLTGDNQQVAAKVAKQIGINEVFAEVLPAQKVAKIKEVQSRGLITAMVGDGINDAPALAQADVGIAIGAGTDVAIETADIILVKSNPQDIVEIITLARKTYSKMVQNLVWATGYNAFAIPAAAGVFYGFGVILSPAFGAVLMSLSTIICAVNARLLKAN